MEAGEAEMAIKEAHQALRAAIAKSILLQKENDELRKTNDTLAGSLAGANRDAVQFREAHNELQLQMEALGIETIKNGSKGLSENFMKAVSDNRLLTVERDKLTDRLVRLSETIIAYISASTSSNVEVRMAVETALREADAALGTGESKPKRPVREVSQGGAVVSIKRDYGIFVVDLGLKSGVGIGMPFEISRKDRTIGKGYVVDVRDNICGAVISQLVVENDTVEVGDAIRLDTQLEF